MFRVDCQCAIHDPQSSTKDVASAVSATTAQAIGLAHYIGRRAVILVGFRHELDVGGDGVHNCRMVHECGLQLDVGSRGAPHIAVRVLAAFTYRNET
jgi:hypothetical protein